jgi:hypothetical protein
MMIIVDKVCVIDKGLRCLAEVDLPERVYWVGGRSGVGESSLLWYKGVGTWYQWHLAREVGRCKMIGVGTYGSYEVQYIPWLNRFGIFTEKMQWYFSEWIGGAGRRESRILENSEKFRFSAVKVVDIIPVVDDHNVYVLRVEGGKSEVTEPRKVMKLLGVMLEEGWNFPWDKGAISDINAEGKVTDVADLFKSDDIKHRFGTVYAVLYSMKKLVPEVAKAFEEKVGVSLELKEIPFSVLRVMRKLGCNISEIWEGRRIEYSWVEYKRLIFDVLMEGVNCTGLEFSEYGEEVKRWYKDNFLRRVAECRS